MKVRTSFVSNSSTTSFILINRSEIKNDATQICIYKNINLGDLKSNFVKSESFEDFIKFFFNYSTDESFYEHITPNDKKLCEGEKLFIKIKKEEDENVKNNLINKFLKICKEENENIYKFLLKIRRSFKKNHEILIIDDVELNSLELKIFDMASNKDLEIIRFETIFD